MPTDPAGEAAMGDSDLGLLRAYEPVLRFTAGELFFPIAVEPYVELTSLWRLQEGGGMRELVPAGELDVERLCSEARTHRDVELSLRFVAAPLDRRAARDWRRRPDRPTFQSGGRFTRVGLLARAIDVLFRATLLLRGRVPGGLVAAAEQACRVELDPDRHPYYGRVVRDGGYVVLQYWIFYAMNDWRSTFGGANDHEADWEQVTVYLTEQADGRLAPSWVAMSAHDEVGDDLRRRWDDPELVREGQHVVVFVGAGSHSGAVVAGEYVTAIAPRGWMQHALRGVRRVARVLTPWATGELARGIGVPFIDYHRGDGEVIGPGHGRAWSPVVIDDDTPWVRHYHGLWGLDTRDRFGGERAPAGPRYERGGAMRQSWADPLGWAGLQKVPPTQESERELLESAVKALDGEIDALTIEIDAGREALRRRTVEVASLEQRSELLHAATSRRLELGREERALDALVAHRAELRNARAAHLDHLAEPPPAPPPHAHLRNKAAPVAAAEGTRLRFLRIWSAISTPLLFAAAAWLLLDHDVAVITGVATFAVLFLGVEAIARRQFVVFTLTVVVIVVAGLVALAVAQGFLDRWDVVLAIAFSALAIVTLVINVRELGRG
jgi:hypothetical protein